MSRAVALLSVLALASLLAAPAFAATQTRHTTGAVFVQRLDVFDYRQTVATPTSTFTVSWDTLLDVEDARLTLFKPAAWDQICPSGDCVATIPSSLIIQETNACGPIHTSEGFTRTNLAVDTYPVTVQGLRGDFNYVLTTSTGTLTHKASFTAVFVDTVVC